MASHFRGIAASSTCVVMLIATGTGLAGCSNSSAAQPAVIMEDAWVRSTDGSKDPSMTAMFGSLVNPGSKDLVLAAADCAPVAEMTQIHQMAMVDGDPVMQEAKEPVVIPAEGHLHLAPGDYHVMLMQLTQPLPVGEEVSCTLEFEGNQPLTVTAPVKEFVEQAEHYHPDDDAASS